MFNVVENKKINKTHIEFQKIRYRILKGGGVYLKNYNDSTDVFRPFLFDFLRFVPYRFIVYMIAVIIEVKTPVGQGKFIPEEILYDLLRYNIYDGWSVLSIFVFALKFSVVYGLAIRFTQRFFSSVSLSSGKLTVKEGLLVRRISEIQYDNIDEIAITKSLFQTLIDTGDVSVSSVGGCSYETVAFGIQNPELLKNQIEKRKNRVIYEKYVKTKADKEKVIKDFILLFFSSLMSFKKECETEEQKNQKTIIEGQ